MQIAFFDRDDCDDRNTRQSFRASKSSGPDLKIPNRNLPSLKDIFSQVKSWFIPPMKRCKRVSSSSMNSETWSKNSKKRPAPQKPVALF